MAESTGKSTGAKRSGGGGAKRTSATTASGSAATGATASSAPDNGSVARSKFNSALEEARAGAVALGAEARTRAGEYGSQARTKGEDYAGQLKAKAGELAVEGKGKASEALSGLAKLVSEQAGAIDDNLGSKYGDYARNASKSLQDTAGKLEQKSVEELGEDARELVRKSPAAAVGLAALAGFLFARLFRSGR